jgi:protein-S-isoprenylcysteine O-methyltransferase Ste14
MPVYVYLQLLFFITELTLLIVKRSKRSGGKNQLDRQSLLILWIVIAGCLTLGPNIAYNWGLWPLGDFETITIIGSAVFALGFIIRWIAVYQLGKMFTVDVAIADEHLLKTNGLYKIVRHPSYLGLVLIVAALGICLNSGLSLLIMFVPTFIAINYRIKVEEKALTGEFGEQYIAYKSRVKKIIPFIY